MSNQLTLSEHQQLRALLTKGGYVARHASEEESAVLQCFQHESFPGPAPSDDSEFEVVAMNDASKRRLVAPGAQEESYGASSQRQLPVVSTALTISTPVTTPTIEVPAPTAVDSLQLPPSVSNLADWVTTIMEKGKYGESGFSYEEMRTSANTAVQQYIRWLIGALNAKMHPQFHDLVAYVKAANGAAVSSTDGVIPGSSQVRRRKNQ